MYPVWAQLTVAFCLRDTDIFIPRHSRLITDNFERETFGLEPLLLLNQQMQINKCLNDQTDLEFCVWLPVPSSSLINCLIWRSFSDLSRSQKPFPLTCSMLCFLRCMILYGQSGGTDGPQCVVQKKKKKESNFYHFQFSTLLNHNQIIYKLLSKFQTVNMPPKHVWLQVLVSLVKKKQVGLASIWSACH